VIFRITREGPYAFIERIVQPRIGMPGTIEPTLLSYLDRMTRLSRLQIIRWCGSTAKPGRYRNDQALLNIVSVEPAQRQIQSGQASALDHDEANRHSHHHRAPQPNGRASILIDTGCIRAIMGCKGNHHMNMLGYYVTQCKFMAA
jgi:hypothetical protein